MSKFGEQRLLRGPLQRWHFRMFGVADPSHYLHHRYLARSLHLTRPTPRRILDAGCGSGDHSMWLARRYPDATVLGVDIDPDAVARASASARALGIENASFQSLDLGRLDLSGFDLIVSIDVLEHVPEQAKVLRLLAQALSPGGVAFYHIPCKRPKPVPFERYIGEFRAWADREHIDDDLDPEEFVSRVTASGVDVVSAVPTFARWSGEAACSLFAIPYRNTPLNRVAQLALAPVCRALASMDPLLGGARYALAVTSRKPIHE